MNVSGKYHNYIFSTMALNNDCDYDYFKLTFDTKSLKYIAKYVKDRGPGLDGRFTEEQVIKKAQFGEWFLIKKGDKTFCEYNHLI